MLVNLNVDCEHKITLLNYNKANSYQLDNPRTLTVKLWTSLVKAPLNNQLLTTYTLSKLQGDHLPLINGKALLIYLFIDKSEQKTEKVGRL